MDKKITLMFFVVFLAFLVFNYNFIMYLDSSLSEKSKEIEDLQPKVDELKRENKSLKLVVESYKSNSTYTVDISSYTASENETNSRPDQTSMMESPISGWTIAVSNDLKHLLGKRVYVEGFGVRRVNDLMNNRYNSRVDILVGTKKKAREIGVLKNKKLILLEPKLLYQEQIEKENLL